jgi:hypothetical protein
LEGIGSIATKDRGIEGRRKVLRVPYKFGQIGEEPKKLLLRRGEILRWIGIRPNEFDKVVQAGLLPWKQLRPASGDNPGSVRFFKKSDVRKVFLENFRVSEGK